MRTTLRISLTLLTVLAVVCAPSHASAATVLPNGVQPVPGPVVTRFDRPDVAWGSGHRGVDLAGRPGETVVAAAHGTVTFAGDLAGRGVVVVDHGMVRTTYEPVAATVLAGEMVGLGQPIGRLQAGHASCPGTTCLHWGLREGDTYLDPFLLLGAPIRLLPASATPVLRAPAVSGSSGVSDSGLVRPVTGPVTSAFGMRRHPVTGLWTLHDGTDLGAECGTPIRAAASGTVVALTVSSTWGNRLVIDHGPGHAGPLVTAYSHAEGFGVAVGSRVSAGQVVGTVGRTGLATGCHLHVQVWVTGRLVDPSLVLA